MGVVWERGRKGEGRQYGKGEGRQYGKGEGRQSNIQPVHRDLHTTRRRGETSQLDSSKKHFRYKNIFGFDLHFNGKVAVEENSS